MAQAMLFDLFKNAVSRSPPLNTLFTGKTVLITGSNTGIGLEAARYFVNLNAQRVILAVRFVDKGQTAREQIEAETGRTQVVKVMELNMQRFDSIAAFVKEVEKTITQLDIVILNAGVMQRDYIQSREGWEKTLQINTISTALLALLLLPKLSQSRRKEGDLPRLIFVNSILYQCAKRDLLGYSRGRVLETLNERSPVFAGIQQYAISKLLALYFMKDLAALTLSQTGEPLILVLACCPGLSSSELYRSFNGGSLGKVISLTKKVFANTPKKGSRTLVTAASLGSQVHGGFWKGGKLIE